MTVGVVMLVHDALHRAEQVARHWAESGCPVVIHVDSRVGRRVYHEFTNRLAEVENIEFCSRHRCEWGTFSLVKATQTGSEMLLTNYPDVRHVYLASGSCLPLRPVSELVEYLEKWPKTDFVESVTTRDVPWTIGGFDSERFTLRFPFSWKRQRRLFDSFVWLQQKLKVRRKIPDAIVPHLGSQWWCLTRQTLSAILQDPERRRYEKYFSQVWIPDESYFQTLARHYSTDIQSRSLTLSKFEFMGKPHVFYDDHLQLLRRSDCFVARKIWPDADKLYQNFLSPRLSQMGAAEPNPGKIDKIFSKAVDRRTNGRAGLYMHSRFPKEGFEKGTTCTRYSVFEGFNDLFEDFDDWLTKAVGGRVHGHLFAPERAEFSGGQKIFSGGLSDSALLRDYNPKSFFTSLLWNTRGEHQCFQFGPRDNQDISWPIATDPNAQVSVITGAWAVPLFRSNLNFAEIRETAAKLQRIENDHLDILATIYTKARVRIWTLAEFVEAPMEPLQTIIDEIGVRHISRLTEAPKMVNLDGFGQFLQNLKNQGMQPQLMGEFPVEPARNNASSTPQRPYLVK
ncbi:MAG: beta-1,6-N-acetylglucosaminyltransferase [Paracoccaceae bacterium]